MLKRIMSRVIALILFLLSAVGGYSIADEVSPVEEPEVTIIKRDDQTIEEYRVKGQLYMIKVVPVVGPPYYLIDSTGDGSLNMRRNDLDPGLVVPSWMIFRWLMHT